MTIVAKILLGEAPTVTKLATGRPGRPFRLKFTGTGFAPGIRAFIGNDVDAWQPVVFKSATVVVLEGGDALAQKFQVGGQVPGRLVNADATQTTVLVTRTL